MKRKRTTGNNAVIPPPNDSDSGERVVIPKKNARGIRLGKVLIGAGTLVAVSAPLVVLVVPAFRTSSPYRTVSFMIVTGLVSLLLVILGLARNGEPHAQRLAENDVMWAVFLAILALNLLITIIAAYS